MHPICGALWFALIETSNVESNNINIYVYFSIADLPMMLHSTTTIGLKRFSTLLLEIHQILGKSLIRKLLKLQIYFSIVHSSTLFFSWFEGCFHFDLSGSLVSHTFALESKVKTVYYGTPALITYRIPTKSNLQVYLSFFKTEFTINGSCTKAYDRIIFLQEAYSTPILPLRILSDTTAGNKFKFVIFLYLLLWSSIFHSPSNRFHMILTCAFFSFPFVFRWMWSSRDFQKLSGKGNNFLSP